MIRFKMFMPLLILGAFLEFSPNISDTTATQPKLTVVLLHGLDGTQENFDVMQQDLLHQLPVGINFIALKETRTAEDTIDVQADRVFQQLKQEHIDKNTPLIFIGHSQGGLKAYRITEKYGNVLDIKGIVTIGTPWQGTPFLETSDRSDLTTLVSQLTKLSQALDLVTQLGQVSEDVASLFNEVGEWPKMLSQKLEDFTQPGQAGIEDMRPGSAFLQGVHNSLPNSQVPVHAIAGTCQIEEDLAPVCTAIAEKFQLEDLGKMFLAGGLDLVVNGYKDIFKCEKHDILVAVSSQLAEKIDVNANFKRNLPVAGVVHFPIDGIPMDVKQTFMLNHPEIINQVKAFIEPHIGTQ